MREFEQSVYELIVKTSVQLPLDAVCALKACGLGNDGAQALAMSIIEDNINQAACGTRPICQDTGMPTFFISTPVGTDQIALEKMVEQAVVKATEDGILRTNSVETLSGKNSGNNLGAGTPVFHFHQWEKDYIDIKLILKGGGCENVGAQYSLPCELEGLGFAGRNLEGVRKCLLHAVWAAQGKGCSPGVLGVCIGSDRAGGYEAAKLQLFRSLEDTNPDAGLAQLEATVLEQANRLDIGPMGLGGGTTLLGCKIGALNRLPASYFVSVAYNCWALRRMGVSVDASSGRVVNWHEKGVDACADSGGADIGQGRVHRLESPVSEESVRAIKAGDLVRIDGTMYTGRDAVHAHIAGSNDVPDGLDGGIIYHCGPVVVKNKEGSWTVMAAGPTTSAREEPYQATVLEKTGLRVVVGKGGMGAKTLDALKNCGAVYLTAIGGAAQFYARSIKRVNGVRFEHFGIPEAMWELEVEGFYAVCTMDSHGGCLHTEIKNNSGSKLSQLSCDGCL